MSFLPTGYGCASVPVYESNVTGSPVTNILVSDGLTAERVDNTYNLGLGDQITLQSALSSPATLGVSDTNQVFLLSAGSIVLRPGLSSLQVTSTAPAVTMQPFTPTDVLYSKSQIIRNPISGLADGSGEGIGPDDVGYLNDVTLVNPSGSNTFVFQFAGDGIAAGAIFEFFLNPASAAGCILRLEYNSVAFATYNFPADAGKFVRVYTPDGTNFYAAAF